MSVLEQMDEKKVFTENKDISLAQLKDLFDDGDIDTSPIYQRDFLEDWVKASRLVESVLLSIPIPTVYLCQEKDETLSVIDGQQRLTSFIKYLKNEFALKGLQELPELNGKKYSELEKEIQKKLKNSTIHAITLLKESEELKYEIFARLNLGSEKLRDQELRNCIYRGNFNNMLEDIAINDKLLPTLFKNENKRKAYQERILRFFALRDYNNYKSNMPKTLNQYMVRHQNDNDAEIKAQKDLYTGTIDIIKQVLGEKAFLQYDRSKGCYIDKFSPSIYDSIVVPFSFFDKHALMKHADEIRSKIDDIRTTDDEYGEFAERSTTSRSSVIGRILKIYYAINSCMSSQDINGSKRIFSDDIKRQLWQDGYVCSYCGNTILTIDDAEVDHVFAFSLGGDTDISNAQLLHRHCNREKSASEIEDWTDGEDETED